MKNIINIIHYYAAAAIKVLYRTSAAIIMVSTIMMLSACERNNLFEIVSMISNRSSSAAMIISFSFSSPSAAGVISGTTIEVAVPCETDVTSLVPVISYTGADMTPKSGVPQNFSSPVTYRVTADDSRTIDYTVRVTVAPGSAKDITSFVIAGVSPAASGVVNGDTHTISATVQWNADVASLSPVITHTGASISPASGEFCDFSSPVTYRVTAADSSYKDYTVTVIVREYQLRDTGPAGGLIFYINSNCLVDGWKYLEAAPAIDEWTFTQWGSLGNMVGTDIGIGTGRANTIAIVGALNTLSETGRAAQLCDIFSIDEYNDWFLPSQGELWEMCWNLKGNYWNSSTSTVETNPDVPAGGVGGFSGTYLSSSEYNTNNARGYNFNAGAAQDFLSKDGGYSVRAVRAF